MKKLLFFLLVFNLSLLVFSCSGGGGGSSSGESSTDTSSSSTSCPSSSTYTLDSSSTADNTTITDTSSITDNSDVDDSTVRVCSSISTSQVDNSTVDNSTIIGSTIDNSSFTNSTITNSTIDNNSTVINSTITNSTIDNSTIDNMTIINISIVIDQILRDDNLDGFNSSDRPTVSSTYVLKDGSSISGNGGTDADPGTNIYIQFSEAMLTSSITVNTSNTNCSGTILVSKADGSGNYFTSCVQMSSSPSVSSNLKTFTFDPSSTLDSTTYKIRVTTGAKDGSGNSMSDNYTTGTGFTATK